MADKLAEIEQRYRDDPNLYWVSEVEWLIREAKRLRTALERIEAGYGQRLSAAELASIARQAL